MPLTCKSVDSDNLIDPSGFVWLWRKSIGTRAFKNPELWKVWTWCLMKASHKSRIVKFKTGKSHIEVIVNPGQFIFGRKTAAIDLDMPESSVRNRIEKLKKMEKMLYEKQKNNECSHCGEDKRFCWC